MKFGKKNKVNLNILSYNICLLGESKVGKTTLIKEVCEKVVGEDGYLFLEMGSERGADAIEGINYVNCPAWDMEYDEWTNSVGYMDVIDDIVENRTEKYPELKTVVIDTYDHMIQCSEQEAIDMWNRECIKNGKPTVNTINEAWGGYGRGEKKAIALIMESFARLKNVGIGTVVIGHVKNKDITDVMTGETYQVLTSDQQSNYFNALKKNLHFLGLAYIDREIVKEKTGKKVPGTKKDEYMGKISGESRKIKFRDDNYAVDSGCRFADIVPEIPLDADAFIKALTDAIKSEASKGSEPVADLEKEQKAAEAERMKQIAEIEAANKVKKELEEINNKIKVFCTENKSKPAVLKPLIETAKACGLKNPMAAEDVETAKKILSAVA